MEISRKNSFNLNKRFFKCKRCQQYLSKYALKNDIIIRCSDCGGYLKEISEKEYTKNINHIINSDKYLKNKGPISINNIKNKNDGIYDKIINDNICLRNKDNCNNKLKLINFNRNNNGHRSIININYLISNST